MPDYLKGHCRESSYTDELAKIGSYSNGAREDDEQLPHTAHRRSKQHESSIWQRI